jgi:hypothetical protein
VKFVRAIIAFFLRMFRRPEPAPPPTTAPLPERRWTRPVVALVEWTGDGSPPPLMWKQCHPRTRATFKAELTCSNGHAISLRGHQINAAGGVSPSVVCRAAGCDFHDWVRLQGWTAGDL